MGQQSSKRSEKKQEKEQIQYLRLRREQRLRANTASTASLRSSAQSVKSSPTVASATRPPRPVRPHPLDLSPKHTPTSSQESMRRNTPPPSSAPPRPPVATRRISLSRSTPQLVRVGHSSTYTLPPPTTVSPIDTAFVAPTHSSQAFTGRSASSRGSYSQRIGGDPPLTPTSPSTIASSMLIPPMGASAPPTPPSNAMGFPPHIHQQTYGPYGHPEGSFPAIKTMHPRQSIQGQGARRPSVADSVTTSPSIDNLRQRHQRESWLTNKRISTVSGITTSSGSTNRADLGHFPAETPEEYRRLELQHHIIRIVTRRNHFAPLTNPKKALDVHTGTGIWMKEVSEEFPTCQFIGLDARPRLYRADRMPPNCTWVSGDVTEGIPDHLGRGTFDIINHRFQAFYLHENMWPGVLAEFRSFLTPTGHLELHETDLAIINPGPVGERINRWLADASASRGIRPEYIIDLDRALRAAGYSRIRRREISFAVGRWGGVPGGMMLDNLRGVLEGFLREIMRENGFSMTLFDEMVKHFVEECEERNACVNVYIFNARPDPSFGLA